MDFEDIKKIEIEGDNRLSIGDELRDYIETEIS
jgi:hypothetical protein